MQTAQVLILDISGSPFAWLGPEAAAGYYATDKVAWELGDKRHHFRGGYDRNGRRSTISVAPIIAISGSAIMASLAWQPIPLSRRDNTMLFKRDRWTCAYCGQQLSSRLLSRDHILPVSRGGLDSWGNCASACLSCNQQKSSKLVDDFRPLLYVPYTPCRFEAFILSGRNVLADQHDYLSVNLPAHSRHRLN